MWEEICFAVEDFNITKSFFFHRKIKTIRIPVFTGMTKIMKKITKKDI